MLVLEVLSLSKLFKLKIDPIFLLITGLLLRVCDVIDRADGVLSVMNLTEELLST